jgi:hypothetical protein
MQGIRWRFAIIVLAVCTRGAAAQTLPESAAGSMRDASFFAATPCMPRMLALNTEPYGSVYDDPT